VHEAVGPFVSHIDWYMYWYGFDVTGFELMLSDANNGEPALFTLDPTDGSWRASVGLNGAGPQHILGLFAILADGTPVNITSALLDLIGSDTLNVRFPKEDSFGTICPG
jgi:hypothetical protein